VTVRPDPGLGQQGDHPTRPVHSSHHHLTDIRRLRWTGVQPNRSGQITSGRLERIRNGGVHRRPVHEHDQNRWEELRTATISCVHHQRPGLRDRCARHGDAHIGSVLGAPIDGRRPELGNLRGNAHPHGEVFEPSKKRPQPFVPFRRAGYLNDFSTRLSEHRLEPRHGCWSLDRSPRTESARMCDRGPAFTCGPKRGKDPITRVHSIPSRQRSRKDLGLGTGAFRS